MENSCNDRQRKRKLCDAVCRASSRTTCSRTAHGIGPGILRRHVGMLSAFTLGEEAPDVRVTHSATAIDLLRTGAPETLPGGAP
jgi:hypothetical protein